VNYLGISKKHPKKTIILHTKNQFFSS